MKVIGISGSPRKDGNTEILVRYALEPFREKGWEVSEFFLSTRSIKPCIACEMCADSVICSIRDDDMNYLLDELEDCDALIIGSPAYYRNVTAQLKALFDRSYVFRNRKLLEGKPLQSDEVKEEDRAWFFPSYIIITCLRELSVSRVR